MRIIVGVPTAGRREILSRVIKHLAHQTRLPDRLCVCPASGSDLDEAVLSTFPAPTRTVHGVRGIAHQRNAILRDTADADLIVFFDDDFLPQPSYLAEAERLFLTHKELIIATGEVIADGILGPGLSLEEAFRELSTDSSIVPEDELVPVYNGYGCNMVVRLAPVRAHGVEFDENLPLYAWWEDVDFSRGVRKLGRIVRSPKLRGVHLGNKAGRAPGKRLGYSQVANIVYLIQKGTVSPGVGIVRISKNITANAVRSFASEPWVDRRGRLFGNLLGLKDLVTGRISPQRVLDL